MISGGLFEYAAALLVFALAFLLPRFGDRRFQKWERWGARLASRQAICVLLVGLAAPLARLAVLAWQPPPQPGVHDEFSYLLAGETFASGRLANPTHPMWVHFESMHIDQQPTYMSMYPPAQGLILALGYILGHPWIGVCISMGLMCGAICWMLYGWLPRRWALMGGVFAVLKVGAFSYWMNSYWGGAASALGGALALGALARLLRRPRPGMALLMGSGIAILANSRPYEGMLIGLGIVSALIAWAAGQERPSLRVLARKIVLPLVPLLLLTVGAMGYYNWRVFGSPLTLPYQINRATYAVSPVLLWQKPSPEPHYRHKTMRDFYLSWELPIFQHSRTISGFFEEAGKKMGLLVVFFYGPFLMPFLLLMPKAVLARRMRPLAIIACVFFPGLFLNAFSVAHYLAPATALIYAFLIQAMRHLRWWRPEGQPVGRLLGRVLPLLCAFSFVFLLGQKIVTKPATLPRTQVKSALESLPAKQLAIVRYSDGHDPLGEWVYNAADIDSSKVVWARDMGDAGNAELLRYFVDRTAWLVEPDSTPPRVTPYAIRESARR